MNNNINEKLKPRPPIVVVMGHIDHGKTTLLDSIRQTDVAAKESGGITQHIGAYEIEISSGKITFIDTPGHEAFSKMRSRGARVADIAILVVAADDGVKAQTREALQAILEAKIPYVVAINKIDKENADSERVKNDLAKENVFLEGRGGSVPFVEISAKSGKNVDHLSETVLLLAELENLKYDVKECASGVVIESHLDKKRGITATLLLKNGILKKGEFILAGDAMSKVKILEDYKGKPIENAHPSSPVLLVGFDKLPQVGSIFNSYITHKEAEAAKNEQINEISKANVKKVDESELNLPTLGVVIKADVAGSAEAIKNELLKLARPDVNIKILRAEVGEVAEDDVKISSSSSNPVILAFNVSHKFEVKELADRLGVEIASFKIIYELINFVKEKIENLAPKVEKRILLGRAKVLKIFSEENIKKQIIGGKVLEGVINYGASFEILRRENKIGEGKIENLQSGKIKVKEIAPPEEFGAMVFASHMISSGDLLEVYKKE